MIRKIAIRNYRIFRKFDLDFSAGVNVLVGKNDSGKSTVIEAINLALTGRLHGRAFTQELSPYLINTIATQEYLKMLNESSGTPTAPPAIIIDIFIEDSENTEVLRGTNNLYGENACGVRIQAELSQDFYAEYTSFISDPSTVRLAPTEYYRVDWLGFSGNGITKRSIPATASVIDPTAIHLQSGVDYHLQQIIRTHLDPKERVELSREYRCLREEFGERAAVKSINEKLRAEDSVLTDRSLSLSIDISRRYTWESSIAAHLDDLPFELIGKGDQNAVKVLLAIGRRADVANLVLLEEPENHLSHTSLRKLINRIEDRCQGKQLIIATHSNYVLNKLGLQNLILLGENEATRITDLPPGTIDFFKKIAGFDTLRLVLSEGAILVEGPSDELVVQRAYLDAKGKLPIDDGIDVISVGLSHKRFLDLALRVKRRVWVMVDNDHKPIEQVRARFADYLDNDIVSLHVGKDPKLNTLEPQIVAVNDLSILNTVLGKDYASKEDACAAMLSDKTGAALSIYESDNTITMPEYIRDVVGM